MKLKLNPKQFAFLQSLKSQKKKRKFLLDCLLEEVELKIISEQFGIKKAKDALGNTYFFTKWKMLEDANPDFCGKTIELPKQKIALTGNDVVDSANIGIMAVNSIIKARKLANEKEEILKKSNEPQPPMEFCVEVTDENRDVLQSVWNNFHKTEGYLGNTYLCSNSLFTHCFSSNNRRRNDVYDEKNPNYHLPIVTTEEFLKYIGREDLIENKGIIPSKSFKSEVVLSDQLILEIYELGKKNQQEIEKTDSRYQKRRENYLRDKFVKKYTQNKTS